MATGVRLENINIITELERIRQLSADLWERVICLAECRDYDDGPEEYVTQLRNMAAACDAGYANLINLIKSCNLGDISKELNSIINVIHQLELERGDPCTASDAADVLSAIGVGK